VRNQRNVADIRGGILFHESNPSLDMEFLRNLI